MKTFECHPLIWKKQQHYDQPDMQKSTQSLSFHGVMHAGQAVTKKGFRAEACERLDILN